jgi:hypothetical protein
VASVTHEALPLGALRFFDASRYRQRDGTNNSEASRDIEWSRPVLHDLNRLGHDVETDPTRLTVSLEDSSAAPVPVRWGRSASR